MTLTCFNNYEIRGKLLVLELNEDIKIAALIGAE